MVRELKTALALAERPCKGSLLVPEQFSFQQ